MFNRGGGEKKSLFFLGQNERSSRRRQDRRQGKTARAAVLGEDILHRLLAVDEGFGRGLGLVGGDRLPDHGRLGGDGRLIGRLGGLAVAVLTGICGGLAAYPADGLQPFPCVGIGLVLAAEHPREADIELAGILVADHEVHTDVVPSCWNIQKRVCRAR